MDELRADPAQVGNGSSVQAATDGPLAEVQRQASLPLVDPRAHDFKLLREAEKGRWLEVERLAAQRTSAALSSETFLRVICMAAYAGELPALEALLKVNSTGDITMRPSCGMWPQAAPAHARMPTFCERNVLLAGIAGGHYDLPVLLRLLRDERIDVREQGNAAVALAASQGNMPLLELLLADRRVEPSAFDNAVLRAAAMQGHLRIIDMLLQRLAVQWQAARLVDRDATVMTAALDAYAAAGDRPPIYVLMATLSTEARAAAARTPLAAVPALPLCMAAPLLRSMPAAAWARRRAAVLGRLIALAEVE